MLIDHEVYDQKRQRVSAQVAAHQNRLCLKKGTSSNLFRYGVRQKQGRQGVSLKDFRHVIEVDAVNQTLECEGLTTYQEIVRQALPHGFLPTVTPELKHITVGGAIVGIGIESTCFKFGFVHDGLLEADVLLPSGEVVTATAHNEYQDLFYGLANSYGTLGYILRAKIKLHPAKPFVRVSNKRYFDSKAYMSAMYDQVEAGQSDFIEGLFYHSNELYLTTATYQDQASLPFDIYRNVYYKALRSDTSFDMATEDYIFRYDPDWFWNVPEGWFFDMFRRYSPRSLRSSIVYNRYKKTKDKLFAALRLPPEKDWEPLIQDWQVPWQQGAAFIDFILENTDIQDQPWAALPVKSMGQAPLFPLTPQELYLNIGCYCYAETPDAGRQHHYTKLLDEQCFAVGGLKMLYSSTFLSEERFDDLYGHNAYAKLKNKYDSKARFPTLYDKAVKMN